MSGSAAFAGRADTGLAQEPAEGFAAQGETLNLAKFFAEVMIGYGPDGGRFGAPVPAGDGGWAARGWRAPEPPLPAPANAS
jgi:hypothetical protein